MKHFVMNTPKPPTIRKSTYTETLESLSSKLNTINPTPHEIKSNELTLLGYTTIENVLTRRLILDIVLPELMEKFNACFSIMFAKGHVPYRTPNSILINQSNTLTSTKQEEKHAVQSLPLSTKNGFKEIVRRSDNRYEMTHGLERGTPLRAKILGGLSSDVFSALDKAFDSAVGFNVNEREAPSAECSYDLQSLSCVFSLPNSAAQQWHVDGPHLSTHQHRSAHIVNVFIPLVERFTADKGPTELRPGSHVCSRDLFRFMLGAKCSREKMPLSVCPLVVSDRDYANESENECESTLGDCLVFDYRTLHRGLANTTNDFNRPVLVLTFKKVWFEDLMNFPKTRSINDLSNVVELESGFGSGSGNGREVESVKDEEDVRYENDALFGSESLLNSLTNPENSFEDELTIHEWISQASNANTNSRFNSGYEKITINQSTIDFLSRNNVYRIFVEPSHSLNHTNNDNDEHYTKTSNKDEDNNKPLKIHRYTPTPLGRFLKKAKAQKDKYGSSVTNVGDGGLGLLVFVLNGSSVGTFLNECADGEKNLRRARVSVAKMYTKIVECRDGGESSSEESNNEYVLFCDGRSNDIGEVKRMVERFVILS